MGLKVWIYNLYTKWSSTLKNKIKLYFIYHRKTLHLNARLWSVTLIIILMVSSSLLWYIILSLTVFSLSHYIIGWSSCSVLGSFRQISHFLLVIPDCECQLLACSHSDLRLSDLKRENTDIWQKRFTHFLQCYSATVFLIHRQPPKSVFPSGHHIHHINPANSCLVLLYQPNLQRQPPPQILWLWFGRFRKRPYIVSSHQVLSVLIT